MNRKHLFLICVVSVIVLGVSPRSFSADCYLPLGGSVFNQPVACADTEEVSQYDASLLGEVRVADDFRFFETLLSPILWVSWHGRYNDPSSANASAFNFFIYPDNGGAPTDPWDTTAIKSWTVPFGLVNQTAACTGYPYTYEYCAEIPDGGFVPVVGETYWLVIQAELVSNLSEFWGWLPSPSVLFSNAHWVGPDLFGVDLWEPASNPAMAFSLYAEAPLVTPTPVPPTATQTPTATPTPTVTPTPAPPTATPVPLPIPSSNPLGLFIVLLGVSIILIRTKSSV